MVGGKAVCGGAWSLACSFFLSLSLCLLFLFVVVFGVVRAQPCEHARYPRTPLRPFVVFCSVPLRAFLLPPPFCVWNGGDGFTMCRSIVLA